jgi:hypothetical protein
MRRTRPLTLRNQVDLRDASQRRAWLKRFGVSLPELEAIMEKVGNSVSAISKEIHIRQSADQAPLQH